MQNTSSTKETKTKEFLRPDSLLKEIPLEPGMVVADFGCGTGHYVTAAGQLVGQKGQVYGLDILEEAVSQTMTQVRVLGLRNVYTKVRDLEQLGGSGLDDTSCDVVIMSSILHQSREREKLLREAYRILKTSGKLLAVEWRPEALFGPPLAQRVGTSELGALLEKCSFRPVKTLPAGSFHYALLYRK